MLAPEYKEVINGRAEIRMVYKVPKVGNVAGCFVLEGKISRNNEIRLIRDNIVIFEGKIDSLKRFKDDAREVLEGFECGIGIEKFSDIKEGDVIEAYSMEEIKRVAVK
jgi:translation initiation factor IF-2